MAGNSSQANTSYAVTYKFVGFSTPVDNDGIVNQAKAGLTIPLKWRLLDAYDQPVTDLASYPLTVTSATCVLGETTDQIEEYGVGASGLLNLNNGYYQVNWKTPSTYAKSAKRSLSTSSKEAPIRRFSSSQSRRHHPRAKRGAPSGCSPQRLHAAAGPAPRRN